MGRLFWKELTCHSSAAQGEYYFLFLEDSVDYFSSKQKQRSKVAVLLQTHLKLWSKFKFSGQHWYFLYPKDTQDPLLFHIFESHRYVHTYANTHAHKYIFHICLCTEEWNKEYMLMRTPSRAFFKMKHFQKAVIVGMVGEGWTNSIEREVLADRLTKVHVAFPFRGERLGTTPPQQTRPWGITQLSIHSFHSDEWGLSRRLAENWREREAERRRFLICLPFSPLRLGEAGD